MACIGVRLTREELLYRTPSRYVGVSYEKETVLRKDSCLFIAALGKVCDIGQLPIATASVYFHVFYTRKDFREHDRYVVAATCLFLAGKVEERGKRVSEIVNAYFHIMCTKKLNIPVPGRDSPEFEQLKLTLYQTELLVLEVIEFNFRVKHPYSFLFKYFTQIFGTNYGNRIDDWKRHQKERGGLLQTAWFFVNDSLRSTLCMTNEPDDVALAAVYLALKHQNLQVRKCKTVLARQIEEATANSRELLSVQKPWHEELFGKSKEFLEEIAHQIMEVLQVNVNMGKSKVNPKLQVKKRTSGKASSQGSRKPTAKRPPKSSKKRKAEEIGATGETAPIRQAESKVKLEGKALSRGGKQKEKAREAGGGGGEDTQKGFVANINVETTLNLENDSKETSAMAPPSGEAKFEHEHNNNYNNNPNNPNNANDNPNKPPPPNTATTDGNEEQDGRERGEEREQEREPREGGEDSKHEVTASSLVSDNRTPVPRRTPPAQVKLDVTTSRMGSPRTKTVLEMKKRRKVDYNSPANEFAGVQVPCHHIFEPPHVAVAASPSMSPQVF